MTSALAAAWTGHDTRLIGATVVAIAVIVVLITKVKLHPFLSLVLGSLVLGLAAGMPVDKLIKSFSNGVGSTVASVGILIALGAMLGKLLADSGGADQIVDTVLGKARGAALPWAMALVAALIGLPMFFEIGLVMLIPVVLLAVKRTGKPLMLLGIPALAGLSVLHGLVPPHPGPLAAAGALNANVGITLAFGLLVGIPTLVIAGPLFGKLAARMVPDAVAPARLVPERADTDKPRPSFAATLSTVLLPVVLMLAKALSDILLDKESQARKILDFIGDPLIALLAAVLVGMVLLGRPAGLGRGQLSTVVGDALGPIAGILLIVGAGGASSRPWSTPVSATSSRAWPRTRTSRRCCWAGWWRWRSAWRRARPRSQRSRRRASSHRWRPRWTRRTARCWCWRSGPGRCSSRT